MHYRRLGRYGIRVSEVALGGWLTQGRTLEQSTTDAVVHKALDLGINFFDSADAYNAGEAEKALARAVKGVRRDDLVLATKCFFPMSDKPNDRGLSRKHIVESVNHSLERLNTDYIDLMQFHRFDPETPLDETVRAIDDLVRQGKVLYWGVSEWEAHQITEVVHVAEKLNAHPPVSNQPRYSLLQRGIEEKILPACEQFGLGLVVFSPLAQGVLTGKYLPGQPPPAGTRGADDSSNMWMGWALSNENLTRIQQVKSIVEKAGFTMPQFALAWCLRTSAVSSVIIGATRPEQVELNVAASGAQIPSELFTEAESILKGESAN